MDSMGDDQYREQHAPSGVLTSIGFCVSTQTDIEKMSVMEINVASEITDPRLGFPNPSSRCSTCGAKSYKHCEGHFGVVKFPFTVLNPYHLSEIAQILNKVCPACKSIKRDIRVKGADLNSINPNRPKGCKYCALRLDEWYPIPKFKVSTSDIFQRSVIIAEVKGKFPVKLLKKNRSEVLPDDYWDFIPKDLQEDESQNRPTRRVLSHTQVRSLLKGIDEKFVRNFVPSTASLFLNSFPITPNSHRVTEITHSFSNGQRLIFDQRTKAYKKLLLRETANQLSTHVIDCLKISKLAPEKSISQDLASAHQNKIDTATTSSGLRWVKDVVLAKRSDHCFRMVVVGNPNIKINEIGIPCYVADRMQVLEHLNTLNMKNLGSSCFLRLVEKGEIYVRREGHPVRVRHVDGLHIGDTIFRPLIDGDLVMINRPPSIHQHSLIGLSVKILPMSSVLSLNPLCCSPFRGDFDGDCLHGYVPQSVETRVELRELVALDRQLINEQSGHNLLSLSHDSLTAAHLITEDGVLLNLFQMQQLQMFCLHGMPPPTIVKSSSVHGCFWTGKQLFSMLLPWDFGYTSNGVCIKNGELISSEGSFWLRDSNDNIFQKLVQHCGGHTLDILHAAQEVLCEWLQMRGLSVSIADLYLSCDLNSQKNLIDEVYYGLQDAEHTCNTKQLMVDSLRVFLSGFEDDDATNFFFDVERLCYEKQKSATLSQASIDTFKQVFKDIQNLIHKYADKDNSFVTMFKAGSKGNLLRIVQHGLCIGLQHSLVPLKFKMPHQLSCSAWNDQKACELIKQEPKFSDSYIPCAVIENSFLTGLNPLECFVHSVTNRESSFSDNADLPGTLSRRIMFFLRDICTAYDGTVRSAYGNQLVQFFCGVDSSLSSLNSSPSCVNGDALSSIAGQPVGSLAACAISEAAYGALDQPISLLQASPLLSLKVHPITLS